MERREPVYETNEVFGNTAEHDRNQVIQKSKKYLRYSICSSFGLTVGFISDNLIEAILLLGLFCAYILCTD